MDSSREPVVVKEVVVSFDICSSSNIIEDLTLTNNLEAMMELLEGTKRFLSQMGVRSLANPYKFTGDGWILLLRESVEGNKFFKLLSEMSVDFKKRYESLIVPLLERPVSPAGLTFGADRGSLLELPWSKGREYIGRPLNIACRLQSAIKDRDPQPGYKVLLSRHMFNLFPDEVTGYRAREVTRTLRNIRGGEDYQCVKVDLPPAIDGTQES
jgi:hypothetical protein